MMSNPIVTITMENGDVMKAELYPEIAPNTVNNFISLVKKGFYDGLIFHRVIPGFMIQGGDPAGTGAGGPDYCIKGEFSQKTREKRSSTASLATISRPQPSSGSRPRPFRSSSRYACRSARISENFQLKY